MAFCAVLSSSHENTVRDVRKELFLHAVEVLNDRPLIEMLLNLLFCSHARLEHGVDQVLEDLPEEEEVVALGDYEVHWKELIWCARFIKELLQACLVLECNSFVDVKHLKHQFFDILDSDNLESFVKQFYQISWCTRGVATFHVDFNLVLQIHTGCFLILRIV